MLVARHEILRTTYAVVEGYSVQIIHDELLVELNVIDLNGMAREDQANGTARISKRNRCFPWISLRSGLRPTGDLFGPEVNVFMLVLHHIATDGYSRGILYSELTAFYESPSLVCILAHPRCAIQSPELCRSACAWLDDGADQRNDSHTGRRGRRARLLGWVCRLDFPRPPVRSYVGGF